MRLYYCLSRFVLIKESQVWELAMKIISGSKKERFSLTSLQKRSWLDLLGYDMNFWVVYRMSTSWTWLLMATTILWSNICWASYLRGPPVSTCCVVRPSLRVNTLQQSIRTSAIYWRSLENSWKRSKPGIAPTSVLLNIVIESINKKMRYLCASSHCGQRT